jgi:hypothetical protein
MEIEVSQEFLKKIVKNVDLDKLSKDKATAFEYQGKKYVCTGSISNGDGNGYYMVWAHIAILLGDYNGKIKPLRNCDHEFEVVNGLRKRGYYGRLITINGIEYVLTDRICFVNENN